MPRCSEHEALRFIMLASLLLLSLPVSPSTAAGAQSAPNALARETTVTSIGSTSVEVTFDRAVRVKNIPIHSLATWTTTGEYGGFVMVGSGMWNWGAVSLSSTLSCPVRGSAAEANGVGCANTSAEPQPADTIGPGRYTLYVVAEPGTPITLKLHLPELKDHTQFQSSKHVRAWFRNDANIIDTTNPITPGIPKEFTTGMTTLGNGMIFVGAYATPSTPDRIANHYVPESFIGTYPISNMARAFCLGHSREGPTNATPMRPRREPQRSGRSNARRALRTPTTSSRAKRHCGSRGATC